MSVMGGAEVGPCCSSPESLALARCYLLMPVRRNESTQALAACLVFDGARWHKQRRCRGPARHPGALAQVSRGCPELSGDRPVLDAAPPALQLGAAGRCHTRLA